MFRGIIDQCIERARAAIPTVEGDYVGEDGLVYCGKCRTRKQMHLDFDGEDLIVPVMCRCMEEKEKEEREREEKQRMARLVRERREECFGPTKLRDATFANARGGDRKAFATAMRYANKFEKILPLGQGLVFYGETGTGKSYLAACVCNAVIERGYDARFSDLRELSRGMSSYSKSENQEAVCMIERSDLLVLDDLGAERQTKYMDEAVFSVIDRRVSVGRPFIVTTNLTPENIRAATDVDKRLYSRLIGSCFFVEVKGADRRRAGYADRKAEMKRLLED